MPGTRAARRRGRLLEQTSVALLASVPKAEWDAEYVNIEQEVLFELILAANYLDIKSLLDLTCAKVASMIKGKTTEDRCRCWFGLLLAAPALF